MLLTEADLKLPNVGGGHNLVVRIVLNSTVHDVSVLAGPGQGVSGPGLGRFISFLIKLFPHELAWL